jgi:FkbM family methyltransferase
MSGPTPGAHDAPPANGASANGDVDDKKARRLDLLAHRELTFDQAAEHVPLLGVAARDGARYLVSTSDTAVGRRLFIRRSRGEMSLLKLAMGLLERAGRRDARRTTLLDIGANIGTTTVTALLQDYGFTRAIACEPEPENFRLLRANVALNGLHDDVTVLQAAVSDAEGEVVLRLDTGNSGNHRVLSAPDAKPRSAKPGTVKVKAIRLDDLIAMGLVSPEEVGLLWIDVQGHEGHVLRGATRLIDGGLPALVEYSPGRMAASGGLAAFQQIVRERFQTVFDLRTTDSEQQVADVEALFAPGKEGQSTDLLLIPEVKGR